MAKYDGGQNRLGMRREQCIMDRTGELYGTEHRGVQKIDDPAFLQSGSPPASSADLFRVIGEMMFVIGSQSDHLYFLGY